MIELANEIIYNYELLMPSILELKRRVVIAQLHAQSKGNRLGVENVDPLKEIHRDDIIVVYEDGRISIIGTPTAEELTAIVEAQ